MEIRLPFVGVSRITEANYRYVRSKVLTAVTMKSYSLPGCDVV
jgi:hypothetical protein